ncbi:MAG: hypothetical protein Q8O67_21805 [Deltaproteobacteria bacterium]|nr:hypothetical protein [Deltaproteobacteria bacterium]
MLKFSAPFLIALAPFSARAEAPVQPSMADDLEHVNDAPFVTPVSPAGIYGLLGGGVAVRQNPREVVVGGYWDARVGVGTRSVLGAEAAYVGSARDITAPGLNSDAVLVSNGLEGVARINLPIEPANTGWLIEPFAFGGLGWSRFNISTDNANTSSIDDVNDVMTLPVGLGMALGYGGVTLDARATFRPAVGPGFEENSLNAWGLGAALGFEF